MLLITEEIGRKLYEADQKFLASDNGDSTDQIVAKFFTPDGSATWYVTMGTPLDADGDPTTPEQAKDWHLFGFADLGDPDCAELGYVLLSQLEEIRGGFGLKVERDRYFTGSLAEIQASRRYNRSAA